MDQLIRYCCWCGSTRLPVISDNENLDPHENATIRLLLELVGLSSNLLKNDIVYLLCEECAEVVSCGTGLKVELELAETSQVAEDVLYQVETVKDELKRRTHLFTPSSRGRRNFQNDVALGLLLSPCFSDCIVQVRLDDAIAVDDYFQRQKLDNGNKSSTTKTGSDLANNTILATYLSFKIKQEMVNNSDNMETEEVDLGHGLSNEAVKFEAPDVEWETWSDNQDSPEPAITESLSASKTSLSIGGVDDSEMDCLFECAGCSLTFENLKTKVDHEQTHVTRTERGKGQYYRCGFCWKEFRGYSKLKSHREIYHLKRSFVCGTCGMICASQDLLKGHARTHELLPFECELCCKKYSSTLDLDAHRKTHATVTKAAALELATREKTPKAPEKYYKCELCGIELCRSWGLKRHMQVVHSDKKKDVSLDFQCEVCNRKFTNNHNLNRHRKSHEEGKPKSCEKCSKSFARTSNLNKHRMMAHGFMTGEHSQSHTTVTVTNSLGEIVPRATDSLNLQSGPDNHNHDHTTTISCKETSQASNSSSQQPKPTEPSTYEYVSIEDIINQSKSETPVSTPTLKLAQQFECRGCFYVYDSVQDRKDHEEKSHMIIRDGKHLYKCGICRNENGFERIGGLWRHKRRCVARPVTSTSDTSTSDKALLFKCDVCGQKFRKKHYLLVHSRIHTGEKPFECDICGTRFHQPNNLARHRRSHTGEKPYECPICKKKFTQRSNLTLHQGKHHESHSS